MSLVESISEELRAAGAGINRALEYAAAASNAAEQVAGRAASSGFIGIAHGMSTVQATINEIYTTATAVGRAVNEAHVAVTGAAGQVSPQQTIAAALDRLATAHDGIAAAIGKVAEARRLVAAVLRGGRPDPMLSRLETIDLVVTQVTHLIGAARQRVETALSEAKQIGAGGQLPSQPAHASSEPSRSAAPAVPQRVRQLAAMLPVRGEYDPTDGLAYDATGRWRQEEFASGRDDSAGVGLVYPLRASWSVTDHAEGHVAARMRAEHVRDVTLVLNQPPCDDEPWGCDRILPAILPPGYTVTVYVADADGVRWHDTYRGTGKGITS